MSFLRELDDSTKIGRFVSEKLKLKYVLFHSPFSIFLYFLLYLQQLNIS
jgi:hypothetical protein